MSLLLAMIGSTLALGIVVSMVTIIIRSVEQSQDLERSTQVFFAIESGLEAGFFHHNARGQGVSFAAIGNVPNSQIITHSATTLDSSWTINGRAGSNTYSGMIYENTPLQLRWFWDNSDKVTDNPSAHQTNLAPGFHIEFTGTSTASTFGSINSEVLLSWLLTKRTTNGVQSLTPYASNPENLCNTTASSFFCDDGLSRLFNYDSNFWGTLIPRIDSTTTAQVGSFISDVDATNFQLIITPTLKFEDDAGNKVAGIPFELTGTEALPLPHYSVSTSVTAGDFTKNLSVSNIPEQTILQAFNYVIFD